MQVCPVHVVKVIMEGHLGVLYMECVDPVAIVTFNVEGICVWEGVP